MLNYIGEKYKNIYVMFWWQNYKKHEVFYMTQTEI